MNSGPPGHANRPGHANFDGFPTNLGDILELQGGLRVIAAANGMVVQTANGGRVTLTAAVLNAMAASRSGPILASRLMPTRAAASPAGSTHSVTLPGGQQLIIRTPG